MLMYYCRFADLITDADLCEMSIPFTLDRRIIVPGAFSAEIPITNSVIADRIRAIVPQKTIVHVYRNEMIVGSYIIWAKQYDGDGTSVKATIQGATLESYLYRRILPYDFIYTDQEQLYIADSIVSSLSDPIAGVSASPGITVKPYESSGILRDRKYYYTDMKTAGDALENLANVDAGFEYAIQTWDDGSTRPREMQFGYDRLTGSDSTFILQQPGDVESWRILYDGTRGYTAFYTRGQTGVDAGQDQAPIVQGPVLAMDYLSAGWPLMDNVADYQNVSLQSTLLQYAYWWAKNRSGPITIPSYTVRANSLFSHGFSPFSLGSQLTVVMNNEIFPIVSGIPTYEESGRIIGFQLKVDEREKESMDIILEFGFDPTDVQ
jgi:hypothetical protein